MTITVDPLHHGATIASDITIYLSFRPVSANLRRPLLQGEIVDALIKTVQQQDEK